MVRYGSYSPPRVAPAISFVESRVFFDEWNCVAGEHPLGEMWRDVLSGGVALGVSVAEACSLIPVTFDDPDPRDPYRMWGLFCKRLYERADVIPEVVAA